MRLCPSNGSEQQQQFQEMQERMQREQATHPGYGDKHGSIWCTCVQLTDMNNSSSFWKCRSKRKGSRPHIQDTATCTAASDASVSPKQ